MGINYYLCVFAYIGVFVFRRLLFTGMPFVSKLYKKANRHLLITTFLWALTRLVNGSTIFTLAFFVNYDLVFSGVDLISDDFSLKGLIFYMSY